MSSSTSEVTVVIPNWNGMRWLPDCLASLARQTFRDFKVVVVDNGSSDESCAWLRANSHQTRLIELGRNTGFAAAVNTGIRSCGSPMIALLNTDTRAEPEWLENLHRSLSESDARVGAVCGKMVRMDDPGVIENAGDILSWQGAAEKRGYGRSSLDFDEEEEIFSCCGGGTLYRRAFLEEIGLFDEQFFAYLEDIDLGLRGRLYGYRYLFNPRAVLRHQGHGSSLPSSRYVRLTTANRLRVMTKNIPARLLWRRLPSLAYGQWFFLVCNRKPAASFLGYCDFLKSLPATLRARKAIRSATRLSDAEILGLLAGRMNQPGILRGVKRTFISRSSAS